jgi:hypothetical protein
VCSAEGVLESCDFDGRRLHLASRGITEIRAGALSGMDLIKLEFYFNSMTMIKNETFIDMPRLRLLTLALNKVDYSSLASMAPLIGATMGWRSGIEVVETGAFRGVPNLEVLQLQHNALSPADSESLRRVLVQMPRLDVFIITGNPLSCDDIDPYFSGSCW